MVCPRGPPLIFFTPKSLSLGFSWSHSFTLSLPEAVQLSLELSSFSLSLAIELTHTHSVTHTRVLVLAVPSSSFRPLSFSLSDIYLSALFPRGANPHIHIHTHQPSNPRTERCSAMETGAKGWRTWQVSDSGKS